MTADMAESLAEFLTDRFNEAGGLAALVSADFDNEWNGPGDADDEVYVGVHVLANQVAADCETKKRIVELWQEAAAAAAADNSGSLSTEHQVADALDAVLLALAQSYADHPDFRDEWRLP